MTHVMIRVSWSHVSSSLRSRDYISPRESSFFLRFVVFFSSSFPIAFPIVAHARRAFVRRWRLARGVRCFVRSLSLYLLCTRVCVCMYTCVCVQIINLSPGFRSLSSSIRSIHLALPFPLPSGDRQLETTKRRTLALLPLPFSRNECRDRFSTLVFTFSQLNWWPDDRVRPRSIARWRSRYECVDISHEWTLDEGDAIFIPAGVSIDCWVFLHFFFLFFF